MSIIYEPKNEMEFLAPFGPTMGYFKMPDELVEKLNSKLSDKLKDCSDTLVGKVSQELYFDDETVLEAQEAFGRFVLQYQSYSLQRNTFGKSKIDFENFNYGIQIASAWFVRQFEHEYNPLHIHTGCKLSCVGYLKLPQCRQLPIRVRRGGAPWRASPRLRFSLIVLFIARVIFRNCKKW